VGDGSFASLAMHPTHPTLSSPGHVAVTGIIPNGGILYLFLDLALDRPPK
jgi:hypothetical protein